jgi:hypothetical protein
VKALRKVGCKVSDTSGVGRGFPDLVVRATKGDIWRTPRILLMEVKTAKGKLTPDQEQFIADWPEVVVVRSVDEALAAVGVHV